VVGKRRGKSETRGRDLCPCGTGCTGGLDEPFTQGDKMSALEIIFITMTFVLPAIFILADDRMWERKKN
jgi:hypothetical protein